MKQARRTADGRRYARRDKAMRRALSCPPTKSVYHESGVRRVFLSQTDLRWEVSLLHNSIYFAWGWFAVEVRVGKGGIGIYAGKGSFGGSGL